MSRIFNLLALSSAIVIGALSGCGGGGGGGDDSSSGGGSGGVSIDSQSLSAATDGTGTAEFSFAIGGGITSVQLIGESDGNKIQLTELQGPSGDLLADSATELTTGMLPGQSVSTFEFPTLQSAVLAGTYTGRFVVKNSSNKVIPGADVAVTILTKTDSDISTGTLKVNIDMVGAVSGSPETVDAIQAAVQIWGEIFGRHGITLDVEYYSFDGPRKLPDVYKGDALYTEISTATRRNALNMVVGIDRTNSGGKQNEDFGGPGGIPGPAIPGPRSAAIVDIISVAGQDGRFNYQGTGGIQIWGDEVLVFGEELANLAGQYLGLQPVVTFSGDKVVSSDRLVDTDTCITEIECRNEDTARKNSLFPRVYKKPSSDDTYDRDQLSGQQTTILQRSILMQ